MSKMNFSYAAPKQPESQIRLPLLTVGYIVLGFALTWMLVKPLIVG